MLALSGWGCRGPWGPIVWAEGVGWRNNCSRQWLGRRKKSRMERLVPRLCPAFVSHEESGAMRCSRTWSVEFKKDIGSDKGKQWIGGNPVRASWRAQVQCPRIPAKVKIASLSSLFET